MSRAALLGLLLVACGPDDGGALLKLNDATKDYTQGCDWRAAGVVDYQPRDPAACYRVYAWLGSRLVDFELESPCDAAELPSSVVYRPGSQLWGYYDRSEAETAKVLRNERLDACP